MITLVLAFPRGRYAATPWGEPLGAVELPPSPWRLLRALYATWRSRRPDLDEATVHGLLRRLAEPPAFDVPRHGVRDGIALFERDAELAVHWSVGLPPAQHEALAQLASAIPYLGRADSRCSGRLEPGWRPNGHDSWSPVDVADSVPSGLIATALLAPTHPLQIDTLLAAPAEVLRRGLPMPPGTRLLGYQRDPHCLVSPAVSPAVAVRFTVLQSAYPPATDSLVYSDLLRQAALNRLGRLPGERPFTLLGGKTADADGGGHMRDQHQHAHYLPLLDGRRLVGLTVWTPGGLPEDELKALADVRQLRSALNDSWRLIIRVAGIGRVPEVVPELHGPSAVWESATPFMPARYPKRGSSLLQFLTAEVGRELSYRGIGAPRSVDILDRDWTAWRRYRPSARMRQDARQGSANRPSAFLRLEFDSPVRGPLALGHLSHFGLGLFAPVTG